MNITAEAGKQVGTFMEILRGQPLSLALVAMNVLLVAFLFYSGSMTLTQRKDTAELIIAWSRETDKLMASCVSADIMKMVLDKFQTVPVQPAQPPTPPIVPPPTPQLYPQRVSDSI